MRRHTRRSAVLALAFALRGARRRRPHRHRGGPEPHHRRGEGRGLDVAPDGSLLVALANGAYGMVARTGEQRGEFQRIGRVPKGLGDQAPPPGTPMSSESVPTSVTIGPDGSYSVGELRGFPATPRTSQIWRIRPGVTDAVCDPQRPQGDACRRVWPT